MAKIKALLFLINKFRYFLIRAECGILLVYGSSVLPKQLLIIFSGELEAVQEIAHVRDAGRNGIRWDV
jgi:hypothetical protein